jgi:hypothetical protein
VPYPPERKQTEPTHLYALWSDKRKCYLKEVVSVMTFEEREWAERYAGFEHNRKLKYRVVRFVKEMSHLAGRKMERFEGGEDVTER